MRPAGELARIGLALIVEAQGNRGVNTDAEVVVGNGQRHGIAALLPSVSDTVSKDGDKTPQASQAEMKQI